MFDNLTRKLSNMFDSLRGRTELTEDIIEKALSEIRIALLEADVAFPVVKQILLDIKEKALGVKILKDIRPHEMVIKIVHDELIQLLGGDKNTELNIEKKPTVILMMGLQGTGKTTSAAKLALYLKKQKNLNSFMISTDIYRPMAREQLEILGKQIGIDTLSIIDNEKPLDIVKRGLKEGQNYDVIFIDTAGRLQIDETLMDELVKIKEIAKPDYSLITVDAMAGQEAVNVAKTFNETVKIDGIILTRADGDSRGGAVLSMKFVSNAPILFVGTGEKLENLEVFYPDRIASRILGMGDIVTLVEKAEQNIDKDEAEGLVNKFFSGNFDLNDMLKQMRQIKRLGSIGGILKLLPGIGKIAGQIKEKLNDNDIKKQEAIILSMTPKERKNPSIILQSRKMRIAKGSGTSVSDVERLLKHFEKMQTAMKQMQNMGGLSGMMQMAEKMSKEMQDRGELPPDFILKDKKD